MHRDMVESHSFSFSFSDHTYRSSSPTISCLVAQEITVIRAKGAGTRVMSFDRIAIRTYHGHIYCISSDKGDTVTEREKKKLIKYTSAYRRRGNPICTARQGESSGRKCGTVKQIKIQTRGIHLQCAMRNLQVNMYMRVMSARLVSVRCSSLHPDQPLPPFTASKSCLPVIM